MCRAHSNSIRSCCQGAKVHRQNRRAHRRQAPGRRHSKHADHRRAHHHCARRLTTTFTNAAPATTTPPAQRRRAMAWGDRCGSPRRRRQPVVFFQCVSTHRRASVPHRRCATPPRQRPVSRKGHLFLQVLALPTHGPCSISLVGTFPPGGTLPTQCVPQTRASDPW